MATPPEEFVGGRLGRSSSSVLALSTSQYGKEDGDDVQIWLSYEKYDGREKHTMILRMFPNETIADVKLRVQARKGWFASQQQLKFGDMELEDSKTIEHVAMAAGLYEGKPAGPAEGDMPVETNHIHLSVHLADIMNVRIRTLEGEALLSAQPDHTVRELKEAVNLLNGYVPEDQHLLLGGKMLEDSKPLGEVGISENAIVHVLVKRTTKVHIKPTNGSQFELSISAGETVGSLKQRIEMLEGIPASSHKVVYNGSYLPENAPLVDYGVDENSVLMLEPLAITAPESESEVAEMNASLQKCVSMLKQAQAGFDLHMAPCLASAGTGGAYFLLGPAGNKVAVFKPEDEEPNAHNNPRGFDTNPNGEGLRKGTLPGEGASREYAAFLLDHGNFAGVPATTMVCLKQTSNRKYASVDWHGMHGKRGSLQVFVSCESDCEEMGVSQFECNEVHKIAILDMRLANTDRNGSNVLVNNGMWHKASNSGSQDRIHLVIDLYDGPVPDYHSLQRGETCDLSTLCSSSEENVESARR
mmetsp:Transcript_15080/g.38335  ORF Transcript_15080/g.38335 Transcript_15080/m.38335 type:complete len:528 (+) Transcript_15080:272-1855(+)